MNEPTIIDQLKWALMALSLEADEQIASFPEFVVVTDEMLLEFDNWYKVVIQSDADTFSNSQIEALKEIYLFTDNLSKTTNYISEKEELLYSKFWSELRTLSNKALAILNWKKEIPPKDRTIFIKG